MNLTEKVAFIKGMLKMADLEDSKENKILKAVIDVLDDLALSVEDVEDGMAELCEQIDTLDEDLASVEEDIYEDDDDCDCDCGCCGDDEDNEDDEDDEEYYEIECPNCHDVICLNEDILEEGGIKCPNCSADLEFDSCEDDDCQDAEME